MSDLPCPQVAFLGDTFGDKLLREWVCDRFTTPLEADVIVDHTTRDRAIVPIGDLVNKQVTLFDNRLLRTCHVSGTSDDRRKVIVLCELPSSSTRTNRVERLNPR
jgi:hypothetical protein